MTARTQTELKARIREVEAAGTEGRELARRDLTVGRFLDAWLAGRAPRHGQRRHPAELHQRRAYLEASLAMVKLHSMQSSDVTKLVRKMDAAGLSTNTQRLARSVLRRALRWAEQEGVVQRNVATLADSIKVTAPIGRTLTPDQAKALLAR